ncbi:hypothetical protein AQUCO_05700044v1 [Aquilegia coerulea]|uniref:Cytochrome P450 n=1 Tax=Aquilegia coerulea TaxID=218851 RepID=A0A2G5CFK1_AQUCA|nr:hypothetical protein AQUCO_05700044v1 [Aquilegia coerulea]
MIYLAIFCLLSIAWWYRKCKNDVITYWPILADLPSLICNAHRINDWLVEVANMYGLTKLLRGAFFARVDYLLTCDPRNFEYITKTNVSNYPKGQEYNKVFDILGTGVFNSDFDLWHGQRTLARSAFTSNNLLSLVASLCEKVAKDDLFPLLSGLVKTSSPVDLEDIFLRYTFDIICVTIFGRNPKCLSKDLPNHELAKAMDDALQVIFFRHVTPSFWWKLCRWLRIGNEKKLHNAWETVDRLMTQYISLKKEDLLQGGQEQNDLLSSYIYFQKEKKKYSYEGDKFLRDSVLGQLSAGRDATGAALSWFFYMILKNPVVEAKIIEELNGIYMQHSSFANEQKAKRPWVFNSGDLKGLVYLHAAMCESLRLNPGVPINRKEVLREDILPDGTVVKPGMTIIMSLYAMGRMESVWGKDCMEYKPERWINENGKFRQEHMDKFFAFGSGPRLCIGKDIGVTMIKSAVANILFNFHVELVKGHHVYPKSSLVLNMKNGMMVEVKPRVA